MSVFLFYLEFMFQRIYRMYMKNLKNFEIFLNEWLDSPGSIDVPGEATEVRVNSRNYTPNNPQMPEVIDAMYETAYFNDFLDSEGKSESFKEFLEDEDRTAIQITGYLKNRFTEKTVIKKN